MLGRERERRYGKSGIHRDEVLATGERESGTKGGEWQRSSTRTKWLGNKGGFVWTSGVGGVVPARRKLRGRGSGREEYDRSKRFWGG